jgi:fructose-bisphosphate aldolase, class II
MTLVPMSRLAAAARAAGRGLGAFNVVQLEHAEAIVAGAEQAGLPVVLQISENTAAYHGSLAPLALATLRVAEESTAEVVVHLDHATDAELVRQAVHLGVPSVMIDASTLPHAENTALTAALTSWCHAEGVWVEAELGEVGGKDGAHAPGVRTDPEEAADYVAATGVDALAVAVGSSHAMTTRHAVLDDGLIAEIASRVPVPLVLHGSSGVPDAGLSAAVEHGMLKINIATHLNATLTAEVRRVLAATPDVVDPRRYLGPARDAVAGEVARLLGVLSPCRHEPSAGTPLPAEGRQLPASATGTSESGWSNCVWCSSA